MTQKFINNCSSCEEKIIPFDSMIHPHGYSCESCSYGNIFCKNCKEQQLISCCGIYYCRECCISNRKCEICSTSLLYSLVNNKKDSLVNKKESLKRKFCQMEEKDDIEFVLENENEIIEEIIDSYIDIEDVVDIDDLADSVVIDEIDSVMDEIIATYNNPISRGYYYVPQHVSYF